MDNFPVVVIQTSTVSVEITNDIYFPLLILLPEKPLTVMKRQLMTNLLYFHMIGILTQIMAIPFCLRDGPVFMMTFGIRIAGFSMMNQSDWLLPIIGIAGFFATVSYLFYYKAIAQIGASKSMALNVIYCAWTIVLTE